MHHKSQQSRPSLLRTWLCSVLAVLGSLVVLPAAPAAADATYLCTGYYGCSAKGYSHAGYAANSGTMYWRMYSGHNCTNYVAYRMVRSGMPNVRPWDGGGNASNWGVEMASITNATPMVGAVAWWKANVPGAGSSGHVAYVERVVSATEIIVSEDSWGGDFHWKRITKSGHGWPSGFIHFNDARVFPTGTPQVQGTPKVGQEVRATSGSWSPTPTATAYQWYAGGVAISGATTSAYTPTAAVVGKTLSVRVTASRSGYVPGTATVTSAAVAPGTFEATAPPAVEGNPEVDETLQLQPADWSPTPARTAVQWYADGVAITGATAPRLQLAQGQIDKRITVRVTARSAGYRTRTVRSTATDPVLAGTIEVTQAFALTGRTRYGSTLTITPGTFQPADAQVTHAWLRDGVPIPEAVGASYTLGASDIGRHITVRTDLTRRTYRSASQTAATAGDVTTRPEIAVRTVGRPRRAVVVLRVVAPGVPAPDGPVSVQVARKTTMGEVVDGRARIVVHDVAPGERVVRVRYAGDDPVEARRVLSSVVVLPPAS